MKIDKIETFAIQAKWTDDKAYWGSRAWGQESGAHIREISTEYPAPLRRRFVYSKTMDTVIVKLTSDDGLIGYGEAKAPVAPQATKQIIDLLLADIVLGADPRDVTVLWERMYAEHARARTSRRILHRGNQRGRHSALGSRRESCRAAAISAYGRCFSFDRPCLRFRTPGTRNEC